MFLSIQPQGDYLAVKWANLTRLTLESLKITAPVQELTLSLIRHGEPQVAYRRLFDGNTGTLAALPLAAAGQIRANLYSNTENTA